MAFTSRHTGLEGVTSGNSPKMPVDIQIIPNPVILVGNYLGLSARVRSFKKPLTESVKEVIMPSIWENFAQEGRPAWERLTQETAAIREAEGYGAESPILIRTGKVFRAATAFARWTIQKDQAFVSNWPGYAWYGPIHQTGAASSDAFGSVGIPQRAFMLIQPGDQRDIEQIFDRWLAKECLLEGFPTI